MLALFDLHLFFEVLPMGRNVAKEVERLIKPVVEELGITLWNVELEKESDGLNLLVTIDKAEGITINDCSVVTKAIDPLLDEADPIPTAYCLEVSSVGAERVLKRSEHLDYAVNTGLDCTVKFFAPVDGVKETVGILKSYTDSDYIFDMAGEKKQFPRKAVARLCIFHEI